MYHSPPLSEAELPGVEIEGLAVARAEDADGFRLSKPRACHGAEASRLGLADEVLQADCGILVVGVVEILADFIIVRVLDIRIVVAVTAYKQAETLADVR